MRVLASLIVCLLLGACAGETEPQTTTELPACDGGFTNVDGACVALCRGGALDCGAHGVCVDRESGPACVCGGGYEGDACDRCGASLQDNDGDGICEPACVPDGCGRGSCDDSSGFVVCTCDEGYAGRDCSTCAPGWQDNDRDFFCKPSCALTQLSCGAGTCTDADGSPSCTCWPGSEGDDCSRCSAGYQDNDGDALCLPSCDGSLAPTCVEHAACNDASGSALCECAVGYAWIDSACRWAGGFVDGEFQNASSWERTGAMSIDTASAGWSAGGSALIAPCAPGAISQVIEMPALEQAEPLAVRWWQRIPGLLPRPMPNSRPPEPIWIAIDGAGQRATTPGSQWSAAYHCLGERAYGGSVQFSFGGAPGLCDLDVEIDRVEVVPAAGLCPTPGNVLNGTFDGVAGESVHGWSFRGPGAFAEGTDALAGGLTANFGAPNPCSSGALTGTVSLPLQSRIPGQALRIHYAAGTQSRAAISIGGAPVGTLVGEGDTRTALVCIPPVTDGLVSELQFSVDGGLGACTDTWDNWFSIRSVEFVEDAACVAAGGLIDGDFETALAGHSGVRGWRFRGDPHAEFERVHDAAQAHAGQGALRISVPGYPDQADAGVSFAVPESGDGAGPALRFWYRTEGTAIFSVGEHALAWSSTWVQATKCVGWLAAGTPAEAVFRLHGGSTCTDTEDDGARAWIDDVELVTDPLCPAPGEHAEQGQTGLGPPGGSTTAPVPCDITLLPLE